MLGIGRLIGRRVGQQHGGAIGQIHVAPPPQLRRCNAGFQLVGHLTIQPFYRPFGQALTGFAVRTGIGYGVRIHIDPLRIASRQIGPDPTERFAVGAIRVEDLRKEGPHRDHWIQQTASVADPFSAQGRLDGGRRQALAQRKTGTVSEFLPKLFHRMTDIKNIHGASWR